MIEPIDIKREVDRPVFHLVGDAADSMHRECYVVGGYVRDLLLGRHNDDLDFVTVGSGVELAQAVAARAGHGARVAVYRNYGTAKVHTRLGELEFVGARRESYRRESRNPIVEEGTLHDDQCRRDFTINAMAICLNEGRYGALVDPFDGTGDLQRRIIRTPLDPDITFSDDPLRMMRAVRFATTLDFDIHHTTLEALKRNAERIKIITVERITTELNKIMSATRPSRGFLLLDEVGLLSLIFPELAALKGVDTSHGRSHKDNFPHTLQVLDNVAAKSDNLWLRWAALLHDIGKPASKRWDETNGWTFHNHNLTGERMVPRIFRRLKLPMSEPMVYVKKLVGLHMRPIALVEDIVTDSAVRRLLFEAGDDIDDLMTLASADITSHNREKVKRFRDNFDLVRRKLVDIEAKDRVRNFQPPVSGDEVMATFGLPPCREVGLIKDVIKDAILDGVISNSYADAHRLMMSRAEQLGITALYEGKLVTRQVDTPVGKWVIAATTAGIAAILPNEERDRIGRLAREINVKIVDADTPLLSACSQQLDEYFAGERTAFDLPLDLHGTQWQLDVWNAIMSVPYGETRTYGELTLQAGKHRGARAAAQACRANRVLIVVPCHRIVAANGIGGFSNGNIALKQSLLDREHTKVTNEDSTSTP